MPLSPTTAAHGIPPRRPDGETAPVPPPPDQPRPITEADDAVPMGLRIAAAWTWRILLVAAGVVTLLYLLAKLHFVVVPLVVALLLSALLQPTVGWLRAHGVPRSLAAAVVLIGGILVVSGTLTGVISAFVNGFPDLSRNVEQGIGQIQQWLQDGPLHVSDRQLNDGLNAATKWLQENRESLTSGALSTATTATRVLADFFLVLFATFFLMRDGRGIFNFLVSLTPVEARDPLTDAGNASWTTLVAYVRATVLVAFIDAVGIGIAVAVLRVPLAFPLAALVFLGAFIPIVGATLSGAVAVLVALVTRGWLVALLVLAAVLVIQQIEGHILQPLIMGRAVALHPLAVIVGIGTGVVVAGIVGALIAVPLVAVLNTAVRRLAAGRRVVLEQGQPPPGG